MIMPLNQPLKNLNSWMINHLELEKMNKSISLIYTLISFVMLSCTNNNECDSDIIQSSYIQDTVKPDSVKFENTYEYDSITFGATITPMKEE